MFTESVVTLSDIKPANKLEVKIADSVKGLFKGCHILR